MISAPQRLHNDNYPGRGGWPQGPRQIEDWTTIWMTSHNPSMYGETICSDAPCNTSIMSSIRLLDIKVMIWLVRGSGRNMRGIKSPLIFPVKLKLSCWLAQMIIPDKGAQIKSLSRLRTDNWLHVEERWLFHLWIVSASDAVVLAWIEVEKVTQEGRRGAEDWAGPFHPYTAGVFCQNPIHNYHECPVQSSVCPLPVWSIWSPKKRELRERERRQGNRRLCYWECTVTLTDWM